MIEGLWRNLSNQIHHPVNSYTLHSYKMLQVYNLAHIPIQTEPVKISSIINKTKPHRLRIYIHIYIYSSLREWDQPAFTKEILESGTKPIWTDHLSSVHACCETSGGEDENPSLNKLSQIFFSDIKKEMKFYCLPKRKQNISKNMLGKPEKHPTSSSSILPF